jgi:hypothetical protein
VFHSFISPKADKNRYGTVKACVLSDAVDRALPGTGPLTIKRFAALLYSQAGTNYFTEPDRSGTLLVMLLQRSRDKMNG